MKISSSTSLDHTGSEPATAHGRRRTAETKRRNPPWSQQALAVLVAYLVVHNGAATAVNDWEGWSVFANNVIVITVWGIVLVGLTFGLLVRWGLKTSPTGLNRAALASLGAGVASLLSYGIYFMWAPFVVAPAAVILASEGLRTARDRGGRGRGYALAGGLLGALSLAYWIFCIAFVLVTGSFPLPGPQ